MKLDEYRRGKYVWTEDDTEPADAEPVEAKFNENQLRNDQGEWTAVGGGGGALDKLKLGKRIQLGEGETLVASQKIPSVANGDWNMPAAVIDGPDGRELRLGIVAGDDVGKWSAADRGGTVRLGKTEMAAMSQELKRLGDVGKKRQAQLLADDQDNDDTITEGIIPAGDWGDLHYTMTGTADGEASWTLDLRRRPPDAPEGWEPDYGYEGDTHVTFDPPDVQALAEQLDEFAALPKDVAAAAGADVTPGNDELHHYWTKGEGLAKWANSTHPWTELVRHLTKHVGRERAKRIASQWFHDVFGIWPGERAGSNPAGPG